MPQARIPSPNVAADVAGVRTAQNDTVAVVAPAGPPPSRDMT